MASLKTKNSINNYLFSFKQVLLVVMVTILCALLGLLYGTIKVDPVYTASRSVILRTSVDLDGKASSVTNNATLAKIYLPVVSDTIKSPKVLEEANEVYKGEGDIVSGAVRVEYGERSLIFTIYYSDLSSSVAKEKLDVLISVVSEVINEQDVVKAERATLIKVQSEPSVSVSNDFFKFIIYGAILGAFISVLIIVLTYVLDNTIKDKDDFEQSTGLSVLAYIEKQKD